MSVQIELEKMKFYAYHGVTEQESRVGNYFIVDLRLMSSMDQCMYTDNLTDTINYAEVYELVLHEMSITSKLIEHVAGRILKVLREHFPSLVSARIKLSKLNPPLGGDVYSASVTVEGVFV